MLEIILIMNVFCMLSVFFLYDHLVLTCDALIWPTATKFLTLPMELMIDIVYIEKMKRGKY